MVFAKGVKKDPKSGIKKGQKARKTIAKENARAFFEAAQLKKWELISDKQAKEALIDQKAREFTINQVIGKPKETLEVESEITIKIDV